MTERHQIREELIDFLRSIALPGRPVEEADDSTNLIDTGLIDSLAVVQIIQYLEQKHGLNLLVSGIDPNNLSSIAGILAAAERASS